MLGAGYASCLERDTRRLKHGLRSRGKGATTLSAAGRKARQTLSQSPSHGPRSPQSSAPSQGRPQSNALAKLDKSPLGWSPAPARPRRIDSERWRRLPEYSTGTLDTSPVISTRVYWTCVLSTRVYSSGAGARPRPGAIFPVCSDGMCMSTASRVPYPQHAPRDLGAPGPRRRGRAERVLGSSSVLRGGGASV